MYHFSLFAERKTRFVILLPASILSCYSISEYFASMPVTGVVIPSDDRAVSCLISNIFLTVFEE